MTHNYKKTISRILLPLLFVLLTTISALAQIAYTQSWAATGLNSWTNTGATGARFTGATACDALHAVRANLYSSVTSWIFTSPNLGTSIGGTITVGFNYKVCNWSGNTVGTPITFGTILVQTASATGGPWTTIGTINSTNHVVSGSCAAKSYTIAGTCGNDVFIRFSSTWGAGDYYLNFDGVNVSETGAPATPAAPTASAASCVTGSTISATGSAPGGETWYWQSAATGTSTALPATTPQTVFTSGTYYIRSNKNSCATAWSTASSVTVTFPLATDPPASVASAGPGCYNTLTEAAAPVGFDYYWQGTNINGTSQANNASSPYQANTAGNYYVRAFDLATSCWSNSIVTSVALGTPPAVVLSATNNSFCGVGASTTLSASSVLGDPNYTYVWSALDGAILSNVTANSVDAAVTNTSGFQLVATGTGSNIGCAGTYFKSIGVYPFPAATMSATPNDTVCVGTPVTINSGLSAGNFTYQSITHAPKTAPGTAITLATGGAAVVAQTTVSLDDGGWGGIPIGFSFNYFGTTYTTVNVGTNATIHFGTYSAGALTDFTFTTFPSVGEPLNVIGACASDMNFASPSGSLKYWTTGISPNRIFVVEYAGIRAFNSSGFTTVQIHLFETTGIVEVHAASSTANYNKVIGLQNGTGTIGAVALATTGTITNQAYRFNPPANYTTTWSPSGNTGTNIFTEPATPAVPGTLSYSITYTNQTTLCSGNSSFGLTVLPAPTVVTPPANFSICGPHISTLTATGTLLGSEVLRWYDAATGGNLINTGMSYTTPLLSATTSYWIETYNTICSSSRQQITITYITPPSVSIANTVPILCGAGTLISSLTASSSNDPDYTYTWSSSDNATLSSLSGAIVTGTTTISNSYTVNAIDNTAGPNAGCVASATTSLSVYPFPGITPTAVMDSVCLGNSTTLNSNVSSTNFTVSCQPFATEVMPGSGVTVLATGGVAVVPQATVSLDDGGWSAVPIGFTFNYFGTNYTSINVSTNGTANFGPYASFNASQFTFAGFPNAGSPASTIAIIAQDLYFVNSGTLHYWVTGSAPNRKFVLEYLNVPGFSAAPNQTAQLILNETTGILDINVASAQDGTHSRYIGLQDGTQTIGATATRCSNNTPNYYNGVSDLITNQNWRFDPPHSYTFAWSSSPAGDISGLTNTSTITALPLALGTTTYSLVVTDLITTCTSPSPATVTVEAINAPLTPSSIGVTSSLPGSNPFCGTHPVTLTANFASALQPYDVVKWYTVPTGGTAFATGVSTTIASVTTTTTYYTEVYNGACTDGASRTATVITITTPPAVTTSATSPSICTGFSTSIDATSSNLGYAYTWNPGSLIGTPQTVSPTAPTVATTNTYTVTASDAGSGCATTATVVVTVNPLPVFTVTPSAATMLVGTPELITAAPAAAAYCNGANNCGIDYISNVVFGSISTSNACDAFGLISTPNPSVVAGATVPYSITTDGDTEGAALWFDWNQDGVFSASENVFSSYSGTVPATYSGSVTIPLTALSGTTRMRVRCNYASAPAAAGACTAQTFGETEDYLITITGGVSMFTWSPSASLFLNNTATTPYTVAASSVYANPTGVTTYTVTATDVNSCVATHTATITVDQPPVNYDCAHASSLGVTQACTYTAGSSKWGWYNPAAIPTTPAIPTSATTCSTGNADDDVWYTVYKPSGVTSLNFAVLGGSNYDPAFEVYTGSCAGLTPVFCRNVSAATNGSLEAINFPLPAALATYYIRVFDARVGIGTGNGAFQICVTGALPVPTNDNPCTGTNISGNSGSVANTTQVFSYDGGSSLFSGIPNSPTSNPPSAPNLVYYNGSNSFAGNLGASEPTPSCGTSGATPHSVWYSFKAPMFGTFDITLRTGYTPTNFTTILTAYTITGSVCGTPVFTQIPGACSTTGTLLLNGNATVPSLSGLGGQQIIYS
jgi:hypothetical protein